MSELLFQDNADGDTYIMQYDCETIEQLNTYFSSHAPALQKMHEDRYKNKFVAFRTIMKVINEVSAE